ncbi:MAG: SocA family protein [Planctomycetaceae bacterium]|jgi:uncharacterized phage-associated protein|nr:SocA family protein [Planctomycetaceae bacterium]
MSIRRFPFRFPNALQATGMLLRLNGGRMKYLRLMKLLYLAERDYLEEEADLITGDRMYALPKGPVLSTVYNLILHRDSQSNRWHRYIKTGEDKYVFLANDPETPDLYRIEKEILERVHNKHKDKDDDQLVEYTHNLPEWKKYEKHLQCFGKKSFSISIEDMLEGIGKPDLLNSVEENFVRKEYYDNTLGGEK